MSVTGLTVNGTRHQVQSSPGHNLLGVLREELGLTGTKYGCGEGACGACTVLVAGKPVKACVVTVEEVAGRGVTTIEGLATPGKLHPVQQAFAELGAMQCGYCTPGMVLATAALLEANPKPEMGEVMEALAGNLCRCCTYPRILKAVRKAGELMRSPAPLSPAVGVGVPAPLGLETRPHSPWDLLPTKKRDYFTVLPDGLVVVLEPRKGSWMATGGAWIHIGSDAVVTAFTGKVDVGQDNRTAFGLLVAEELRVPFRAVRVVLGDTDYCPYDVGTFGSNSMPSAGEDLRATAAAARGTLEAMAAAQRLKPGWTAYRRLLTGARRTEVVSGNPAVRPASKWTVAGKPTIRENAREMVTGALRYPSDLVRPGMLHAKILRPPSLRATLRSVDLAAAQSMPGVIALRQGDFVGVAAPDSVTAERALAAISAQWNTSLQPGEKSLSEDLRSNPIEVEGWSGPFHHEKAHLEEALKKAAVRLTETYTTAYIAHAPLEPRAVVAEWAGKRLTIWTGTQTPFMVRQQVAEGLGLDESRVRVIVPPTGGGFGGKHAGGAALEAARLARVAGRPVKLTWTREEEFRWGYFRPAAVIDITSGADRTGRLTAWEFKNYNSGSPAILTPYSIPNQRIDFQPAASPLPQGSYRALAATANNFARESHMDEVAHLVDRDPLELRLATLEDDRLAAVLEAAATRCGWAGRRRGGGHGMGIAGGVEKGGRIATCIEVEATAGGPLRIIRVVTAYECGALVNPDTVRNQIEGATVMALGAALFEVVHFDAGKILNASFSTYRVPRFADVPPIEVLLLDRRDIPSAGAGETPLIAVAPALANAIFEATGVRLRSLPLIPSGIVE